MNALLLLVISLCIIISEGQVCVQVVWSSVKVRSSPCGDELGTLPNGRKTTLTRGLFATPCTLSGTTYNFVAISDYNGWVASEGLQFCNPQCVNVDTNTLNVRNSPCGTTVVTQYLRNQEKSLTGTAVNIANCSGKNYIWAQTADGHAVTEFLAPTCCQSTTKPSSTGTAGIDLIKSREGLVNCWYLDPVGLPTICWGHLIKPGDPYTQGTCLTNQQCDDLLVSDLVSFENCVKNYITVGLNQNQFDALVDFTYNVGCGSLQSSTLRTKLNAGNYSEVCTELAKWRYAGGEVLPGLVTRRNLECNLFNSCEGI